jgi:hypothetical protein
MAWYMLEKNIEGIVNELNGLARLNYSEIPRHIEEAALLLRANTGALPGPDGLKISSETEARFSKYLSSVMYSDRTTPRGGSEIQKELRNTFWYYLDSR